MKSSITFICILASFLCASSETFAEPYIVQTSGGCNKFKFCAVRVLYVKPGIFRKDIKMYVDDIWTESETRRVVSTTEMASINRCHEYGYKDCKIIRSGIEKCGGSNVKSPRATWCEGLSEVRATK